MVTGRPSMASTIWRSALVLLVLVRHVLAVHEQELGAQQPDAFGAGMHRHLGLARQLDVGQQPDALAVAGDRRQLAQPAELPLVALQRFQPALVVRDGGRRSG